MKTHDGVEISGLSIEKCFEIGIKPLEPPKFPKFKLSKKVKPIKTTPEQDREIAELCEVLEQKTPDEISDLLAKIFGGEVGGNDNDKEKRGGKQRPANKPFSASGCQGENHSRGKGSPILSKAKPKEEEKK